MKKFLGILLVLLLLAPIAATAAPTTLEEAVKIADIDLQLTVTSGVTGQGYYTDYQAFVNHSDNQVELFCVENQPAYVNHYVDYEVYTLSNAPQNVQAAWIAEQWWLGYNAGAYNDTTDKGRFQLMIWDLLNTITDTAFVSGEDLGILNTAMLEGVQDFTSNWLIAVNDGRQDYLMRVAPVPEPATLLLLGTGLVGLAGVSRKKFKK